MRKALFAVEGERSRHALRSTLSRAREGDSPGWRYPNNAYPAGEKFTASPAVCSATTEAVTVCIKRAGSEQMPPTEK